jgi:small-conductance mechanosensitive channel
MIDLSKSIDSLKNNTIDFIPKVVVSIIIFIITITVANWIRSVIIGDKTNNIPPEYSSLKELYQKNSKKIFLYQIADIVYYLIAAFGIIFAITNLGIQTATIFTILGTCVIAIGLSLQGVIGNIWAGLYISLSDLYKIGDNVKVNETNGTVNSFTLFNTQLIDADGKNQITIPNTMVLNNVLTNFSKFNGINKNI